MDSITSLSVTRESSLLRAGERKYAAQLRACERRNAAQSRACERKYAAQSRACERKNTALLRERERKNAAPLREREQTYVWLLGGTALSGHGDGIGYRGPNGVRGVSSVGRSWRLGGEPEPPPGRCVLPHSHVVAGAVGCGSGPWWVVMGPCGPSGTNSTEPEACTFVGTGIRRHLPRSQPVIRRSTVFCGETIHVDGPAARSASATAFSDRGARRLGGRARLAGYVRDPLPHPVGGAPACRPAGVLDSLRRAAYRPVGRILGGWRWHVARWLVDGRARRPCLGEGA
jgi:hypothetical protein